MQLVRICFRFRPDSQSPDLGNASNQPTYLRSLSLLARPPFPCMARIIRSILGTPFHKLSRLFSFRTSLCNGLPSCPSKPTIPFVHGLFPPPTYLGRPLPETGGALGFKPFSPSPPVQQVIRIHSSSEGPFFPLVFNVGWIRIHS